MNALLTTLAVCVLLGGGWFLYSRHQARRVTGLAVGVFDFCHEGHVNLLRRAAERCDRLIVAVHTDATVRGYKNVQPANNERERAATIEALGIADEVVLFDDRVAICRRFRVNRIFHGDDWRRDEYRDHWGEDLLTELGIELVMLPHTPGVSSTRLRSELPGIGWWLYSSVPGWSRAHIFSHLRGLFRELGGTWFLASSGRDLVRQEFPTAPCVFLESGQAPAQAARSVEHHDLDVIVTAHFNYANMTEVLGKLERPLSLVVLSHGRSGKSGTSSDMALSRGQRSTDAFGHPLEVVGNLSIHDWSFAADSYMHLDPFLSGGGSFTNPVPATRPRVLILPTWSADVDAAGSLLSRRWLDAFHDLARDHDLWLSPHPLAEDGVLKRFVSATGANILPAEGHSHVHVPRAHVTVCDLSGAFWEALLFDTPAILAASQEPREWPAALAPSRPDLLEEVPECGPAELAATVRQLVGTRAPRQNALAEQRLGRIDGQATRRVTEMIGQLTRSDSGR